MNKSHAILKDYQERVDRAIDISKVLGIDNNGDHFEILDIGTGSGSIAHGISVYLPSTSVTSIDVIDERIIKEGYAFSIYNGENLHFQDASFDYVILNHVIEHVGDRYQQIALLSEIKRVLKPCGDLYLGVPNKWSLIENHYKIPFLGWLPLRLANKVMATLGHSKFDINHVSKRELNKLLMESGLDRINQTGKLLRSRAGRKNGLHKLLMLLAAKLTEARLPFIPTIIYTCRKPAA